MTYTRRKQTSECFNGEKFERPVSRKASVGHGGRCSGGVRAKKKSLERWFGVVVVWRGVISRHLEKEASRDDPNDYILIGDMFGGSDSMCLAPEQFEVYNQE